jgi:uncharacterized protein (TIGR04222 family)
MNPLDLRGPEFLAFFIAWSLGVLAILAIVRALWQRLAPTPGTPLWAPGIYPGERDAYAIALLRDGPAEVANALLGGLVSAGYLTVDGRHLRLAEPPPAGAPRLSPLEEEALRAVFPSGGPAVTAQEAGKQARRAVERHIGEMQADLERQGLAPPESQRWVYAIFLWTAFAAIPGLGLVKLLVALARGHSNVGFLLVLMILSVLASFYLLGAPPRTMAGQRYLAWLQESHRGLVQMIGQGRQTGAGEQVLAAGIYGLDVLPGFEPLLVALKPPQTSSASGCSAGSGCGGGSSCGGGGCGGGGCGGCGA